MKKYVLVYISFWLIQSPLFAQNEKTEKLDTVSVNSSFLIEPENIRQSLILHSGKLETSANLNQIIEKETPFQLREYGAGMVSGISIRGASPAQVSVIWNNVPVNSPLNGQTDLNTLAVNNVNRIKIYTGDASFLYGSGATGGAVLLQNLPDFSSHRSVKITLIAGDFGKWLPSVKIDAGKGNWAMNSGFSFHSEKNHFQIDRFHYTNSNAEILNRNFNLGLYRKFKNNLLTFNMLASSSDRNLPGTLHSVSNSKLINKHYRFAFNWKTNRNKFRQLLTAGYLFENYTYFYIKGKKPSGHGLASTLYLKENFTWHWTQHLTAHLRYEWQSVKGQSKNFDPHVIIRHSLMQEWFFRPVNKLSLTGGLQINMQQKRKSFTNGSHASVNYEISKNYGLKLSYNTGYRFPTFNDLFWKPGGNPTLQPEKNHEWNFRNTLNIKQLKTIVYLDVFRKKTFDLIRWQPGNNGLWHPVNIDAVKGTGAEFSSITRIKRNKWNIRFKQILSYQKILNLKTKKLLNYSPQLLYNANIRIRYKHWETAWHYRFQSLYFTDPDNLSVMPPVYLNDLELNFRYKNGLAGLRIDNIFNVYYEWMPAHPMPGRKINLILQINLNKNYKNNKS